MTTTVTTTVLEDGPRHAVIHRTGVQTDGTGETNAVFANPSTFSNVTPREAASHFAVKKVRYSCAGFGNVQLFFNSSANDPAVKIPGSDAGEIEFDPPLTDPQTTGSTGIVLLTTTDGAVADNATYDITLHLIKKQ